MRAFDIRLGDEDRAQYPDDPEWLAFDPAVYDNMEWRLLAALESQLGVSIFNLIKVLIPGNFARGFAATAWLARQQAGLEEPGFADFRINPMQIKVRLGGSMPAPLARGSAASGATDRPASKPSVPRKTAKAAVPRTSSTSSRPR